MKVNGKVKNLIKRPSTLFFVDVVYRLIECENVRENKDLKSIFESQWKIRLRAIFPMFIVILIIIGFILSLNNYHMYNYFSGAPLFKFVTISFILTYFIRKSFIIYNKNKRKFHLNTCLKYFLQNYSHNEFKEYFDKHIES